MQNIGKLGLLIFMVFPVRGLYADYSYLSSVEERAHIYNDIGVDTGAIESVISDDLPEGFLEYAKNKQEINFQTAIRNNHLLDTIKECVFLKEGAMGEHLPQLVVDFIAKALARFMLDQTNNTKYPVYYYRVDKNLETFDVSSYAPCTLAIEHDGRTLLMQGHAQIP